MDLQEVLTELPSVRSFCLPPSMAPSCMNHPEQFMTSWAPHNKSKKEKSLENISVLSSKWRKTDMVPTPQRIYFLSCFGLNWSWWRALSPNPTLMPLSLWISAKFIFATSTHRVVTLFLFLHWHLWQQSSPTPAPPRHWLWFTMHHLRTLHGGGERGFRPETRALSSPLSHCKLCVCVSVHVHGWIMIWVTLWWLLFFFFTLFVHPSPSPVPQMTYDRTDEDIRADNRIARRTPAKHNARKKTTSLKNKRDNPLRHLNSPVAPSQRPPTTLLPLWSFTSSFLLQNKGGKKKDQKCSWDNWPQVNTWGGLHFGSRTIDACYCK